MHSVKLSAQHFAPTGLRCCGPMPASRGEMAANPSLNPLNYELPKTPQTVMKAWLPRLQAVAVVTALFAGVESQLISGLPDAGDSPSPAHVAVRFFAYSGLLLNLGATLSSILLLIAVASLPSAARSLYVSCSHGYPRRLFDNHAPHVAELNKRMVDGHGETYVLRAFGIARGWGLMLRHCIFCFLAGCICAFVHVAIQVWLVESLVVAAIVMPGVALGVLPPLIAFMFYMDSPPCKECAEERKIESALRRYQF